MREIKFRAWDQKEEKWLLGCEYPNLGGFSMFGEMMIIGEYASLLSSYFPDRLKDIVLMQYTGLKDKNGVEIYEGDIISHKVYRDWKSKDVVFFNELLGKYELAHCGDENKNKDILIYLSESEIIGNIYQNPELLK